MLYINFIRCQELQISDWMYSNGHKKDHFYILAVNVYRKNYVLHQSGISVVIFCCGGFLKNAYLT